MRKIHGILFGLILLGCGSETPEETANRMEGTWTLNSIVFKTDTQKEYTVATPSSGITVTFTSDQFTFQENGQTQTGQWALSADEKSLDITRGSSQQTFAVNSLDTSSWSFLAREVNPTKSSFSLEEDQVLALLNVTLVKSGLDYYTELNGAQKVQVFFVMGK